MNCFYHSSNIAVAQCVDCNKGLCGICTTKYAIPICDDCNNARKRQEAMQFIKPIAICAILFIVGYNLSIFAYERTLGVYLLMCAYGGWKFINRFLPDILILFSLRTAFFFYAIKLVVAVLVGFLQRRFIWGIVCISWLKYTGKLLAYKQID